MPLLFPKSSNTWLQTHLQKKAIKILKEWGARGVKVIFPGKDLGDQCSNCGRSSSSLCQILSLSFLYIWVRRLGSSLDQAVCLEGYPKIQTSFTPLNVYVVCFVMTRPGIEPQSRRPLAKTLLTRQMAQLSLFNNDLLYTATWFQVTNNNYPQLTIIAFCYFS